MEYRKFGPTNYDVSVIGKCTLYFEQSDKECAIAALKHGLDIGIIHADTAELYGKGKAEKIIDSMLPPMQVRFLRFGSSYRSGTCL